MKNKQAKHNRKTLRKHHKEIHLSELEHLRMSDKLLREQNGHLRILCRTQMVKLDEMDARCAAVSLELITRKEILFLRKLRWSHLSIFGINPKLTKKGINERFNEKR